MEWYFYDFIGISRWKYSYWFLFNTLNFKFVHKIIKSQVIDKKPKNNPIQGRCY